MYIVQARAFHKAVVLKTVKTLNIDVKQFAIHLHIIPDFKKELLN
jgi:hypothetical protein